MTFETNHSVTLKIWDRSAIDHTLDALVHDISTKANAHRSDVAVTLSGPNTFTVSLNRKAAQGVSV
ncbi:hypothetical protein AB0N24_14980 [Arthrobacter sp. NPDC093128]|uniref:hypothetical protein n=1 Tax=Arthrobacter sp. NPDC093128 TaxID=3154979 RepID=UPI00341320FD